MEQQATPTVRDIVKEFGGHSATAEMFGVTVPAVSNWIAAGAFPARLHLRVLRECEARGIKYDPAGTAQVAAE